MGGGGGGDGMCWGGLGCDSLTCVLIRYTKEGTAFAVFVYSNGILRKDPQG